jgi:hypothetical protein
MRDDLLGAERVVAALYLLVRDVARPLALHDKGQLHRDYRADVDLRHVTSSGSPPAMVTHRQADPLAGRNIAPFQLSSDRRRRPHLARDGHQDEVGPLAIVSLGADDHAGRFLIAL